MTYDKLFRYSLCAGGWLHRYKIKRQFNGAIEEVCDICKDIQYFKENIPSKEYINYHLRETLQPRQPIFKHEYNR